MSIRSESFRKETSNKEFLTVIQERGMSTDVDELKCLGVIVDRRGSGEVKESVKHFAFATRKRASFLGYIIFLTSDKVKTFNLAEIFLCHQMSRSTLIC